ncbi:aldo/keto reductase, partial [Xanthomonas citri pv. mangiferaeindicae]|uniref:aldo/keto reductase n=1 Tax=Xanthomonas citri TaxID=346 RepID=UPI003F7DD64F
RGRVDLQSLAGCPVGLLAPCCTPQQRQRRGVAATAVALAWAIRSGNVIAIPESGTPAHVRANAAACTLQLHADDLAEIDRAFAPPTRKQPLDLL